MNRKLPDDATLAALVSADTVTGGSAKTYRVRPWEPVANAFSLVSVVVANLLLWAVVFSLILPQAGATP